MVHANALGIHHNKSSKNEFVCLEKWFHTMLAIGGDAKGNEKNNIWVEGDEKTIIQACETMYPDPWDDHKHLISTKSCTDEGTKINK